MIKLSSLLMEDAIEMYKEVGIDECIQLIHKYASKSYKNVIENQNYIYRGIKNISLDYLLVDGDRATRHSAWASGNFYTLIIDYVFTKSSYPNRSNGIICTSSFSNADNRGQVYYVIPFDDVKLAVCPESDIWYSFRKNLSLFSLGEFNEQCVRAVNMLKKAKLINKDDLPAPLDKNEWTIENVKKLFFYLKKYKYKIQGDARYNDEAPDVVDMAWQDIMNIFNPVKNNITLVPAIKYKHQTNKEIWFNGKALLIDRFSISKLNRKMKSNQLDLFDEEN